MPIRHRVRNISTLARQRDLNEAGKQAIELILDLGLDGGPRFDGASIVAWRALEEAGGDVEAAIGRLTGKHTRTVSTTGFVAGLGGVASLPVAIPTDVITLYSQGSRLCGAIAELRGYDLSSPDVRSAVAISLVGEIGSDKLRKLDGGLASIDSVEALSKLPAQVLLAVNRRIGVRLVARMSTKSVMGLSRAIPVVSGGLWGTLDAVNLRKFARSAKANFPAVT